MATPDCRVNKGVGKSLPDSIVLASLGGELQPCQLFQKLTLEGKE